jgi:hypothetical protein
VEAYVSSPVVLVAAVRVSSAVEGDETDPGCRGEMDEVRSDSAIAVTAGVVGVEVLRSRWDCNLRDHPLALSLILEKILGRPIFLPQPRKSDSELPDLGVFERGETSNSSSNILRPRTALFPSLFASDSPTLSIHSQTMTTLPMEAMDRMY